MRGLKGLLQPATIFVYTLLMISFLSAAPIQVLAQTELSRISAVERSDGLGLVIRYHLSEPVDSFEVIQPSTDFIQMKLLSEDIDTTGIIITEPSEAIKGVYLYALPNGVGIDIELGDEHYYHAQTYYDKNERDLLLALTESTLNEIEALSNGVEPYLWSQFVMENLESDPEGFVSDQYDNDYVQIHENLTFDTVIIDAGHGGKDPGTIGHKGLREKDISLSVALKLGSYINEYFPEINVVYTREDDVFLELEERGRIANRERGDLFVSIHANAFRNPGVKGSEVYFLGLARSQSALDVMKRENSVVRLENGDGMDELTEEDLLIYELANAGNISMSEKIAEKVEHQFRERAQRPSRGIKQAQFVVLYHASMPALMVELGFITNPGEAQFLSSDYGQSIVASAIFRAIRDYKNEYEQSTNISRSN